MKEFSEKVYGGRGGHFLIKNLNCKFSFKMRLHLTMKRCQNMQTLTLSSTAIWIFFLIHLFWRPHHSHSVYSILNIEMLVHENPLLCNNMLQHFICHFQKCPLSKSMLCWQRKAWILNLNVTENKEEKWYHILFGVKTNTFSLWFIS